MSETCGGSGTNGKTIVLHGTVKPKQTNADRIRGMSDEELAEFIGGDPMHDICPNNCHDDLDRPCKVCALDWLKEEVPNG